jgi:hypothetical protein
MLNRRGETMPESLFPPLDINDPVVSRAVALLRTAGDPSRAAFWSEEDPWLLIYALAALASELGAGTSARSPRSSTRSRPGRTPAGSFGRLTRELHDRRTRIGLIPVRAFADRVSGPAGAGPERAVHIPVGRT